MLFNDNNENETPASNNPPVYSQEQLMTALMTIISLSLKLRDMNKLAAETNAARFTQDKHGF